MKNKYFIKVKLLKSKNEIKDILSRTGIKYNDKLYQSCHYIKKNNNEYIIHFKEYFGLFDYITKGNIDNKKIKMLRDDFIRRDCIIKKLHEWEYIDIIDEKEYITENKTSIYFEVIKKTEILKYEMVKKINI